MYSVSFIDSPLGGFGEILPLVITAGNISPNPLAPGLYSTLDIARIFYRHV
jgi:hypothetical protein